MSTYPLKWDLNHNGGVRLMVRLWQQKLEICVTSRCWSTVAYKCYSQWPNKTQRSGWADTSPLPRRWQMKSQSSSSSQGWKSLMLLFLTFPAWSSAKARWMQCPKWTSPFLSWKCAPMSLHLSLWIWAWSIRPAWVSTFPQTWGSSKDLVLCETHVRQQHNLLDKLRVKVGMKTKNKRNKGQDHQEARMKNLTDLIPKKTFKTSQLPSQKGDGKSKWN